MDLDDLVNFPRETLSVELKEWINFDNKVAQAKIAKHMAAIANHGGGYIVFGFCDDETIAPNRPDEITHYNRDNFGRIANKYLAPPVQCRVVHARSSSGFSYPVVRVPSHGGTPICAKAGGPQDDKGKPQGIQSGSYYIRKVGPKSEAISAAEEWQPLIRRCVSFDRDALLGEIANVMQPIQIEPQQSLSDKLETWHKESAAIWQAEVEKSTLSWPIEMQSNHVQFSYLIASDTGVNIPDDELRPALEKASHGVQDTVWTGWSMFYPFSPPEIAPAFHPEREDGTGPNVLVSNLLKEGNFDIGLPDFWRYGVDGRASILRPFREDRQRTVEGTRRAAGTWLSPETVIRETTEVVTHALIMAEHFAGNSISFRCTWQGLSQRKIDDFGGVYCSPGQVCQAPMRTTVGTWGLTTAKANWHKIVAELSCPILSLFDSSCSADFVARMAPKFKTLSKRRSALE